MGEDLEETESFGKEILGRRFVVSKTVHCDMYLLYRQKVDSAEREPINALLESLAASCYKVGLTNV